VRNNEVHTALCNGRLIHQTARNAKTFTVTLVAGIVLLLGVSVAGTSENSAARDLAAAKSSAFGGIGVAGLMSEGERNLRAVLERPDASQQLQAALSHATPAGKLYILVGLRRCDREPFHQKIFDSVARPNDDVEVVSSSHRFKRVDSMIIYHGRHGDCSPF
jgi:hypothetical protein